MAAMPPMEGQYNIPEEPESPYQFYSSGPNPPPQDDLESIEIASVLTNVVQDFLQANNLPDFNEILREVFGEYAVGEFPDDRTMCFFISDLDAFTPALIRILQTKVLAKFPLWRLRAQFEERSIGIYPQGVWLGDQWVDNTPTPDNPIYLAWLAEAKEYRERRNGPLRRQIAYVRRQLPLVISNVRPGDLCEVGCFDSYQPHLPGHALWLLQLGTSEKLELEKDIGRLSSSAVSASGELYPEYDKRFSPYTDVIPPFWIDRYLIESRDSREFAILDSHDAIVGRMQVDEVIKDEDLKREEDKIQKP